PVPMTVTRIGPNLPPLNCFSSFLTCLQTKPSYLSCIGFLAVGIRGVYGQRDGRSSGHRRRRRLSRRNVHYLATVTRCSKFVKFGFHRCRLVVGANDPPSHNQFQTARTVEEEWPIQRNLNGPAGWEKAICLE